MTEENEKKGGTGIFLRRLWRRGGSFAFAAFIAVVLLVLCYCASVFFGQEFTPLVGGMSPSQVYEATKALSAMGVPFRLEGGTVLVPEGKRSELVRLLSAEGTLPEDAPAAAGTADGDLQSSAARLAASVKGIKSAKVDLHEGAGKVTVTVWTDSGAPPEAGTVDAVAALVACVVPGVGPGNVEVVDGHSPALPVRPAAQVARDESGSEFFAVQKEVERTLAEKVHVFFAKMGIEAAAVVSVELDLDRVKERIKEIDPSDLGPAVTLNKRTVRPEAAEGTGRVEERETGFAYGEVVREIVRAPKGLARVRASIVLFDRLIESPDGGFRYDSAAVEGKLEEFRELAANALGVKSVEDIMVRYLPSARPAPKAPEEPTLVARTVRALPRYASVLALCAAALAVLVFYRFARHALSAAERAEAAAREKEEGEETAAGRLEAARKRVSEMVNEDPDLAAAVMKRWTGRSG